MNVLNKATSKLGTGHVSYAVDETWRDGDHDDFPNAKLPDAIETKAIKIASHGLRMYDIPQPLRDLDR